MLSGVEIGKTIKQKAGFEYNRYYDTTKMNRLLRDTLTDVVWQKIQYYRQSQKIAEELQPLIVMPKVVPVVNNKVSIKNMMIASVNYSGLSVVLTVANSYHNLQSGDIITLSGFQGLTGLDTAATITAVTTQSISFTNSIIVSGTYVSNSGIITSDKFIPDYWYFLNVQCNFPADDYYNFITSVNPLNALGRFFDQPTSRTPAMEEGENFITIFPLNKQCTEITIYYVKKPQYEIDVADTEIDYSLWFNDKMLNHITDVAVLNWKKNVGDTQGMQNEAILIAQNP